MGSIAVQYIANETIYLIGVEPDQRSAVRISILKYFTFLLQIK